MVKLFLPSTNRNQKYLIGYLALYILHRKWKNEDGFSLFLKEAAKLSAGFYSHSFQEAADEENDSDTYCVDSDSEKSETCDETSDSDNPINLVGTSDSEKEENEFENSCLERDRPNNEDSDSESQVTNKSSDVSKGVYTDSDSEKSV